MRTIFLILIMGLAFAADVTIQTTTLQNQTNTYATPTQISVFSWDFMFGIVLVLIGLAGIYISAVE
jgi:hypothetical protein